MGISRSFESGETFAEIDVLDFIFLTELDEQLLSAGNPIERSADHAELGEALEVEEVGDAEHGLEVAHDWVAVGDVNHSLRGHFTKFRRLWGETSTDGKR